MNHKYLTCLCLIGLFSLSAALYCATNEPPLPLAPPKIYPSGLESWKAKSNSFGAKIADSCRIVQLPNGKYQPQFLLPKLGTNAESWTPLFEGDIGYSSLDMAQLRLRRAFEVKKEVTDGLADAIGSAFSSTNPPAKLAPPTHLESVEAAKTNAPASRAEPSGISGSFEEGAIFGALAFARNPDVRDPKVIVEIARGLWQAQKRADAQRQTNSQSK